MLDDRYLKILAGKIKDYSGLCIVGVQFSILNQYVENRVFELDTDISSYILMLNQQAEMKLLINALTTNETYFFRDENQFKFLDSQVFPNLKNDSVIWTSACSSGEEALSLALLAKKHNFTGKIIATDINSFSLEKFQKGEFRKSSLREDGKSFHSLMNGIYKDVDKRHIEFNKDLIDSVLKKELNLVKLQACQNDKELSKFISDENVSLILTRNVLIYFDAQTQKKVVSFLAEKLKVGGILLLSPTEISIFHDGDFENLDKKKFGSVYYFEKKSSQKGAL